MAIQKYAPQLLKYYSADKIMAKAKQYDERTESDVIVFGKSSDRGLQLDNICNAYIGANGHLEMLQKYPILQLSYNLDGSKKDIITLLKDREAMLENGSDAKSTDELYRMIANKKNFFTQGLEGIKPEILALGKYIQETGTEDEFVYDLLRDRLKMKNLTPENIESLIQQQKKAAEVRRKQLRAEKDKEDPEIKHEEEESIKDEVGDEFKLETEAQQQEQQQVETMWQNRFQSWDRKSITLPNADKKKEEAVQAMQDVEIGHVQEEILAQQQLEEQRG